MTLNLSCFITSLRTQTPTGVFIGVASVIKENRSCYVYVINTREEDQEVEASHPGAVFFRLYR